MKILVVTEQRQGKWNNASFETLVAAQQIAAAASATVSAAVIGKGVAALAGELATKNVAEVVLIEHDLLDAYTPDGYCAALKQVIESAKPDLVLFPHTYQVRDFAPKLAAVLGKGMVGDCVGFRNEGGRLVFVRQMFQGKTAADVTFTGAAPLVRVVSIGRLPRRSTSCPSKRQGPGQLSCREPERCRHSHQATRTLQGSKIRRGPHPGSAHCFHRPRHQGA
jgi:electron transfer flavoprotein alpha subunit